MDFNCYNCDCKTLKPDTAPIFISSRIRLARNVDGGFFGERNFGEHRGEILENCKKAISGVRKFDGGYFLNLDELNQQDRDILFERNIISRELLLADGARGVYVGADCTSSVMINEEDHLRIQVQERGLCLDALWKKIDGIDNQIEKRVRYAYSERYGYLTACPTNTGTGMRASVMMHLPGLSLSGQMEPVIRGLNHMGMVARGANGEGSEPSGSFYQISNQQTLGFAERDIIGKITAMGVRLAEFETNARMKLLEDSPELVYDKIARAWAVLESCVMIAGAEAIECLSLLRLASDLGFMPVKNKIVIDTMLLEVRPAHLERDFGKCGMDSNARDILRASILKGCLKSLRRPRLPKSKKSAEDAAK